jgi:hypothetical protein
MTLEDVQLNSFLQQLYQAAGGETGAEVSMYAIGDALGLDRSEAGSMAEDLIIDGLAELKNLAGGISITAEGLQALDIATADSSRESGFGALGNKEIVESDAARAVEAAVTEIRTAVSSAGMEYGATEEIIIDIKTLETQLMSPRPKTKIIREVLWSLASVLAVQEGNEKLADSIRRMIDK